MGLRVAPWLGARAFLSLLLPASTKLHTRRSAYADVLRGSKCHWKGWKRHIAGGATLSWRSRALLSWLLWKGRQQPEFCDIFIICSCDGRAVTVRCFLLPGLCPCFCASAFLRPCSVLATFFSCSDGNGHNRSPLPVDLSSLLRAAFQFYRW